MRCCVRPVSSEVDPQHRLGDQSLWHCSADLNGGGDSIPFGIDVLLNPLEQPLAPLDTNTFRALPAFHSIGFHGRQTGLYPITPKSAI